MTEEEKIKYIALFIKNMTEDIYKTLDDISKRKEEMPFKKEILECIDKVQALNEKTKNYICYIALKEFVN